jgi:hypothetical protein
MLFLKKWTGANRVHPSIVAREGANNSELFEHPAMTSPQEEPGVRSFTTVEARPVKSRPFRFPFLFRMTGGDTAEDARVLAGAAPTRATSAWSWTFRLFVGAVPGGR